MNDEWRITHQGSSFSASHSSIITHHSALSAHALPPPRPHPRPLRGSSPGPLMMLVITTTLRGGFWQGLRVAIAPFLSDVPIIFFPLLVLGRLPSWALGAVGVVGGLYVIFLGSRRFARPARSIWRNGPTAAATEAARPGQAVDTGRRSLLRGATVNALSPHPWLFWATVGADVDRSHNQSPVRPAFNRFYTTLFVRRLR